MEQQVPVKEGETYEVEVQSVGAKGDGICRVKGFVVFVPNVSRGDYIKIRVKKVLPKVAFGDLVEKLEKPANMKSSQPKRNFARVKMSELKAAAPRKPEYKTDVEETDDFGSEFEDEDEM